MISLRLGGRVVRAHLANSGRLTEILTPGAPILLRRAASASPRKTKYDAVLAICGETLVSLDARLAGELVAEGILSGRVTRFGRSRA